jgi:DeoR/GlpR family transcriptional regulator of sugar metabolism
MTGTPSKAERHSQILSLIQTTTYVSVAELSQRFSVSPVTVRDDLVALEKLGQIVRNHGGAMVRPIAKREPGFALRQRLQVAEKQRIACFAATLVREGECIFLDASTTAWYLARELKNVRELTVITNGLFIASEFLDSPNVTVVVPGGALRLASASLVGQDGVYMVEKYNVQKGFFGARGLSPQEGLTDVNESEVALKRRMAELCREVIGILDASKWGEISVFSFALPNQIQRIISDIAAPAEMALSLRDQAIDVTLV